MIRISATTLEDLRRLVEEDIGTEAELIAKVRQEPYKRSWQAQAGSAWHTCLEKQRYWNQNALPMIEQDGSSFLPDAVKAGCDAVGPGVWEVKATILFASSDFEATVVCKGDHLNGLVITDNKSKWGNQIDLSAYDNSLQWRLYLLAFRCQLFRYIAYAFRKPDKNGYCHLKEIRTVKYYPYPGMEKDVMPWVRKFIDWVRSKGLESYLHRQGTL